MRQQYDDTNRGQLYREEDKRNPNGPDYTGFLDVGGVPHRLVGWIKESSKTGKKFLSISVEPKREQNRNGARPAAPAKHPFDDEIGI